MDSRSFTSGFNNSIKKEGERITTNVLRADAAPYLHKETKSLKSKDNYIDSYESILSGSRIRNDSKFEYSTKLDYGNNFQDWAPKEFTEMLFLDSHRADRSREEKKAGLDAFNIQTVVNANPTNLIDHSEIFRQPLAQSNTNEISKCLSADGFIYQVHFKRSHRNFYLSKYAPANIKSGDFVKVEGDRGEDLGIVLAKIPATRFHDFEPTAGFRGRGYFTGANSKKYLLRFASMQEREELPYKVYDEEIALQTIRQKIYVRGLPMKILDAEYQFDRHKLVFYFEAKQRIDFRDLVSELFSQFKTRIWMQQVDTSSLVDQENRNQIARDAGFLLSSYPTEKYLAIRDERQAEYNITAVEPNYSEGFGLYPGLHSMHQNNGAYYNDICENRLEMNTFFWPPDQVADMPPLPLPRKTCNFNFKQENDGFQRNLLFQGETSIYYDDNASTHTTSGDDDRLRQYLLKENIIAGDKELYDTGHQTNAMHERESSQLQYPAVDNYKSSSNSIEKILEWDCTFCPSDFLPLLESTCSNKSNEVFNFKSEPAVNYCASHIKSFSYSTSTEDHQSFGLGGAGSFLSHQT